MSTDNNTLRRPSDQWSLHQAVTPLTIGVLLIIALLAAFSAKNMELDKAVSETGQAISSMFGFGEISARYAAVASNNVLESVFVEAGTALE